MSYYVVIIDYIISNNAFQTSDIELLMVKVQGTPARSKTECLQSETAGFTTSA